MKHSIITIMVVLSACPGPGDDGGATEATSSDSSPTEGYSSSSPGEGCADLSCPGLVDCTKIGALCIVQGLPATTCWEQVERLCHLSQVAGDPPTSPGYTSCEMLRLAHINAGSGYDADEAFDECDAISPALSPMHSLDFCPSSAGCRAVRDLCVSKGFPGADCVNMVQDCATPLVDKKTNDPRDAGCPALMVYASQKLKPAELTDLVSECWSLCW